MTNDRPLRAKLNNHYDIISLLSTNPYGGYNAHSGPYQWSVCVSLIYISLSLTHTHKQPSPDFVNV